MYVRWYWSCTNVPSLYVCPMLWHTMQTNVHQDSYFPRHLNHPHQWMLYALEIYKSNSESFTHNRPVCWGRHMVDHMPSAPNHLRPVRFRGEWAAPYSESQGGRQHMGRGASPCTRPPHAPSDAADQGIRWRHAPDARAAHRRTDYRAA